VWDGDGLPISAHEEDAWAGEGNPVGSRHWTDPFGSLRQRRTVTVEKVSCSRLLLQRGTNGQTPQEVSINTYVNMNCLL
jgi:hypothetical protein